MGDDFCVDVGTGVLITLRKSLHERSITVRITSIQCRDDRVGVSGSAYIYLNADEISAIQAAISEKAKTSKKDTVKRLDRDLFVLREIVQHGHLDTAAVSVIAEKEARLPGII